MAALGPGKAARCQQQRRPNSNSGHDLPLALFAPQQHLFDLRFREQLRGEGRHPKTHVVVVDDARGALILVEVHIVNPRESLRQLRLQVLIVEIIVRGSRAPVVLERGRDQPNQGIGVLVLHGNPIPLEKVQNGSGVCIVFNISPGNTTGCATAGCQQDDSQPGQPSYTHGVPLLLPQRRGHPIIPAPSERPRSYLLNTSTINRLSTGTSPSRILRPSAWISRSAMIASGLSKKGRLSRISPSSQRSACPPGASRIRSSP